MRSALKATYLAKQEVVYRPPEVYLDTANQPLFTVINGPVWVTALFFYANEAVGAAADWTLAASGVAMDSGAAALNNLIGETAVWPLQAADPAVGLVECQEIPTPVAFGRFAFGFIWAPGAANDNIQLTLTTAADGAVSWYIVFTRMAEWSEVIVS